MSFTNKMPEWKNEGTEPSANLKTNGFAQGYKPPAGVFNHFWALVTKAITELQNKAVEKGNLLNSDLNEATTAGIYRYNNPVANAPSFKYGQLLVLHGEGDTIAQVAFGYEGYIEYRTGNPAAVGGTGEWTKWYTIYSGRVTVPISNGGTGATTAAGALSTLGAAAAKHKGQHNRLNGADPINLSDVAYFGMNPIDFNDDTADTIQNWADKGSGYCYYAKEGDFGVQPSRYGQLVNLITGADVFQLWHTLPQGANYIRSGSGSAGWVTGWVKIYDEKNKPTPNEIGAADYIVEQGKTGNWTYRKWNSGVAECWGTFYKENETYEKMADANIYISTVNITLPFTFKSMPIGSASHTWNYGNWVNVAPLNTEVNTNSYTGITLMKYQNQSTTNAHNAYTMVSVIGSWK